MLVVNVKSSWPQVQRGERSAEDSVLGDWAALSEQKLRQYADAILGVADNAVVAAFDITDWSRGEDGRVRFMGTPSARWAHLLGGPSPVTWTRGQARPIRYLDTGELDDQEPAPLAAAHRDRVTVGGWMLHLDAEGNGTLRMPAGARLTVITTP
ncbi:hypothetical protein GB931_09400 [Modestobacter sp. I12A-02628]|uniref:Uncharacterized protein n=1 Tax=Goekera deserti TaxID=2497753 RepID=A0A7K3WJQ6_9ACTN|nr:hypothetical protein [Goekera deserti]MPQ98132.1 hypothetical protein [Goekera deserti]NDI48780.1 hypothetical protein [Goekera deserti]NEL56697.1 hypothetical protein [Goekera deserti]